MDRTTGVVPDVPWRPREPRQTPGIGLIGCGAISEHHLRPYRAAGYRVLALCDVDRAAAERRQREFFPAAAVHEDFHELLARDDIAVVDIATHPAVRVPQIEAALRAGKHVLSQKPLCLDLADGERLCDLADRMGRRLAVNQNGRFAPHWAWTRQAVAMGLVGEVESVDLVVFWDHNWVVGTAFDDTEHLLLLDFGIHWFDLATCLFGERRARSVFARVGFSRTQRARQPLLGHAVIDYEGGRATLVFNGSSAAHRLDTTTVVGGEGAILCEGPDLQEQRVTWIARDRRVTPELSGRWFSDGMHGAMAELLLAIEEERAPSHAARGNLASLAVCFAACASARDGQPRRPGEVARP